MVKNRAWELADLLSGHKAIGLKLIYKLKKNLKGEIIKHKARFVAKWYA